MRKVISTYVFAVVLFVAMSAYADNSERIQQLQRELAQWQSIYENLLNIQRAKEEILVRQAVIGELQRQDEALKKLKEEKKDTNKKAK